MESIIFQIPTSGISILYLVSVAEEVDLSVTWSETPKAGFPLTWPKYQYQYEYVIKEQIAYARNKDLNQLAHLHSLVRIFTFHTSISCKFILFKEKRL